MKRLGTTLTLLLVFVACSTKTRTLIWVPEPETHAAGPSSAATLGIPPGHLPGPGQCRVWKPGTPPGRQPRPRSRPCEGIAAAAPAGSWVVYRPTGTRKLVHVRVVDERRPGIVVRVRVFEAETGKFVREETP
jgi:hypothetical protein